MMATVLHPTLKKKEKKLYKKYKELYLTKKGHNINNNHTLTCAENIENNNDDISKYAVNTALHGANNCTKKDSIVTLLNCKAKKSKMIVSN
jgi:hypothetical protein